MKIEMVEDSPRLCVKCGHEERFSDNEGGTCEARIVLEQAELGVETTVCGCFCEFPFVACVQCEANARWNEAGGYQELAEQCRAYCRRGHREESTARTALAAAHSDRPDSPSQATHSATGDVST